MPNSRTQPDATWNNGGAGGYVPLRSDWEDLDRKVFQAINGDLGGTWAPSSPIIIQGSGLQASGLAVDYAGSLESLSGARFFFTNGGPGPWPKFLIVNGKPHALSSRTILQSTITRRARPHVANWQTNLTYACVQANGGGAEIYQPTGVVTASGFVLLLRTHNQATLSKATLRFRVALPHNAAPGLTIRMRIVRTRGGVIQPLASAAAGADANGWIPMLPNPASGAAWFDGGNVQSLIYPCDQNNVIDTSQYLYFAHIEDEVGQTITEPDGLFLIQRKAPVRLAGAGAGMFIQPGAGVAPVPTRTGMITIDGVTTVPGDRVLDTTGGGIVIANLAAWTRASDCQENVDFTPGFIVAVTEGTAFGGGDMRFTSCDGLGHAFDLGFDAVNFAPRGSAADVPATGNLFHSVQLDFTGIANMQFQ